MPLPPKQRVGKPRLDPRERLRHRFYEPLLMLSIMNLTTGRSATKPSVDIASVHNQRQTQMLWSFLDALAWFGDHKHGGSSVSAVAGEQTPQGIRFWVCGRFAASAKRISAVIDELQTLGEDNTAGATQKTREVIINDSIKFSQDRVKKYRRDLAHHLGKALQPTSDPGELDMAKKLQDMLPESSKNHLQVCQAAYLFTHLQKLDTLAREGSTAESTSRWAEVRHCVIRLRSWHKNGRILIDFATKNPQMFVGATCEYLRLPHPASFPEADAKTNVRSALRRMTPADNAVRAEELYNQLQDYRGIDFDELFVTRYSDQDVALLVHAEVYLLEHFYFNSLSYVLQHKYIGCSKPSCYCCHIYQRNHPSNPVVRPAHGTAWVKWCPPLMAPSNGLGVDQDRAEKHNLEIMNGVITHLRRDVFQEIDLRMPKRGREPDSTSGGASIGFSSVGGVPIDSMSDNLMENSLGGEEDDFLTQFPLEGVKLPSNL